MTAVFLRQQNQSFAAKQYVTFSLHEKDDPTNLAKGVTFVSGDVKIAPLGGGGSFSNTDNLPVEMGTNAGIYELQLSSTEFAALVGGYAIRVVDQDSTKVFMDCHFTVEFYGGISQTSNMHSLDLDPSNGYVQASVQQMADLTPDKWVAGMKTIQNGTVISGVTPTLRTFRATYAGDVTPNRDDAFKDRELRWLTGNLANRVCVIEDFNLSNGDFTVSELEEAPAIGDTFVIM